MTRKMKDLYDPPEHLVKELEKLLEQKGYFKLMKEVEDEMEKTAARNQTPTSKARR